MYYIASKSYENGLKGTYDSQSTYTELGYEMCVSYLHLKHLISKNLITDNDVIVTKKDREFLYENDHKNVITFDDFISKNVDKSNVEDLVEKLMKDDKCSEWLKEHFTVNNYKYKDQDYKLIRSFKKSNIVIPNEPFICISIRKRDHASWRNVPDDYVIFIINNILKKFVNKIYVVGNNVDNICDMKTIFSSNLQDFATLSSNQNCLACISSASGIIFLPYYFSNSKTIHMIPTAGTYSEVMDLIKNGHPLYHGYNTRFSPSKYFVYDMNDRYHLNQLYNNIKENQ